MLQPEFYENAPDKIVELLYTLENWTIQEIAQRIKAANEISSTAEHQLLRLMEMRRFDTNYKEQLKYYTKKTLEEIDALYGRAAEMAHAYDKRLFDFRGIPFVPYKENPHLQQMTHAIAEQTKSDFTNISQSLGFTTKNGDFLAPKAFFNRTLDNIALQTSSGITSYNEAIKRSVKEMVNSGIRTVAYPKAKPRRIESVVRANVLTGLSQLAGQVVWKNIEDLGAELVETTAHWYARPTHVPWQGKVFALNGSVNDILKKADEIRDSQNPAKGDKAPSVPLSAKDGGEDTTTTLDRKTPFDFNDTAKMEKELSEFTEKYKDAEVEHAVVYSPDGNKYELTGNSLTVNIYKTGKEALNGAVVIHNHPGRDADSFSKHDFQAFIEGNVKRLHVTYNSRHNVMEYTGKRINADDAIEVYEEGWYKACEIARKQNRSIEMEQYETMQALAKMLEGLKFYDR